MRWFAVLCLSFLAGCLTGSGAAPEDLSAEVTYLADPTDAISTDDIARHLPRFAKAPSAPPEFPGGGTSYWFHLVLPRARLSAHAVLVVDSETIAVIELVRRGHAVQRTGNLVPLHERAVPVRDNVFLVNFGDAEHEVELLFKARSPTRIRFRLVGWPHPAFLAAATTSSFELGMFFGAMAIMAGYNLFLAYALRKGAYAYYALYTVALALLIALYERLLLQVAPFIVSAFRGRVEATIVGLLVIAWVPFVRAFLQVRTLAPRLDRALTALVVFAVPLMFSGLVLDTRWYVRAQALAMFAAAGAWVIAVVIALRAGLRPARYMAAALALTLAAGVMTSLVGLRVIPDFEARLPLLRFGIVLEQLILSFGLADLYREVQRERLRERLANLEEREQLQREVHDTVATDIQAALMDLPPAHDTRPTLERALENARDFATLLQMSRQSQQTLEEAIDAYVRTLRQQPGCSVDYHFDPALDDVPPRLRLHLYRIFQEWTSNCLRHGKAKRFRIELVRRRGATRPMIVLRIQSDGAAFRWSSTSSAVPVGTGLANLRYRCDKLGGGARARAGRDGGCNFVLRAPL